MESVAHERPLALEGFRVRAYRSIRDSGFVPTFPLTALVGSRESGKTSLLQALRGLDPSVSVPYSLEQDAPRGSGLPGGAEHVACWAAFRLGEGARGALLGRRAIGAEVGLLLVGRSYGGALVVATHRGGPEVLDTRTGFPQASDGAALRAFVRENLPPLLFAGNDSVLPGTVALDGLDTPGAASEESGAAALGRLFALAGIAPDELGGELDPRRLCEACDRVGAFLSGLRPRVRLDPGADGGGPRVHLRTHEGSTSLDRLPQAERFRLTLDLRVAEARLTQRAAPVLLLDGPGRAFRRSELRLRSVLEAHVRTGATVLYTARLPFDVELQHPEQVLVLAPDTDGPRVARDPRGSLALRAALGMTGRASFRIDELNLVVEGPSDAGILVALSELLQRSGEPGLPPDVHVTVAGGSHEVAAVATFLGRLGLGVVGLFDSDEAGTAAREELEGAVARDERLRRVEVLDLAPAAGLAVPRATIEDLFPPRFVLDVAREVCDRQAAAVLARAARERGGASAGGFTSRLAAAFEREGERFPKGRLAAALEEELATTRSVADLPAGMTRHVRRLMRTLREATDHQRSLAARAAGTPAGRESRA